MVRRLDASRPGFEGEFAALLAAKLESAADVNGAVAQIIGDVRARGDAAVIEFTGRFDRFEPGAASLRFTEREIGEAVRASDPGFVEALRFARGRIEACHRRQMPAGDRFVDDAGVEMGYRWTAIESVGLYVPGGTASYPSSVLMNCVPAVVAGVERIVMAVPTPDGEVNPLVLAAAHIAGVSEIYRIGGAQAVAALAYGTESVRPVAKIVGPGNAYVAAAKRQVFGAVGIDMIAGPSEVLIIADGGNDPDWIAADLLAQAEHDGSAQSILITDDGAFADAVCRAVGAQLKTLPRAEIAGASWREYGAVITVGDLSQSVPLADRIAPEHLEVACAGADDLAARIRNAGAVFIGRFTPEAIGDYVAGPNHVLPTARSARFSSGLGVPDFMKRTSLLKCSAESLAAIGPAAITLGRAEGLDAHARSVAIRLNLPAS